MESGIVEMQVKHKNKQCQISASRPTRRFIGIRYSIRACHFNCNFSGYLSIQSTKKCRKFSSKKSLVLTELKAKFHYIKLCNHAGFCLTKIL